MTIRSTLRLSALTTLLALPLAGQTPQVSARLVPPSSLTAGAKGTLVVEMTMGRGWHVNAHTPSEDFLIPTTASLTASSGTLSGVRYPKPVERRFAFSEKPLLVYEGTVRFEADLTVPAGAKGDVSVSGTLSYQACNESQCFAPAKLPLAATALIAGVTPKSAGGH